MRYDKKKVIIFGISTLSGVLAAIIALMAIDASFLKMPDGPPLPVDSVSPAVTAQAVATSGPDYKAVTARNLFRAKLQIEIPKQKTAREIEEETLTGIIKTMVLKGVMLGRRKRDDYAVIDRGGQKGVWTYEMGEVVENGLVLKEIRKDSVKLEKGEFGAVLRLFAPAYERTPGTAKVASMQRPRQAPARIEAAKDDIKTEGSITRISKSLAEQIKTGGNAILSSIAVRPGADGIKIVAVDQGSIAQKIGIAPDDTIQEVNGHKLSSTQDMSGVYDALKNATSFEVKVLRKGKPETLHYEIR